MMYESMNPQEQLAFTQYRRERVQRDFCDAQTMPLYLMLRSLIRRSVDQGQAARAWLGRQGNSPRYQQIAGFQ